MASWVLPQIRHAGLDPASSCSILLDSGPGLEPTLPLPGSLSTSIVPPKPPAALQIESAIFKV
jgi:hypothetical protein